MNPDTELYWQLITIQPEATTTDIRRSRKFAAVLFLVLFSTSLAVNVQAQCYWTGTDAAGCNTWTTCNGSSVAYVQAQCPVPGGGYVWNEYYPAAIMVGCGANCTVGEA